MRETLLLCITLSTEGYWLAGQEAAVDVAWNAPAAVVPSVLHWRLVCGAAKLAAGQVRFSPQQRAVRIVFEVPTVRVRTEARFVYRLIQSDTAEFLSEGSASLFLYPADPLAGVGERLKDGRVWIWDSKPAALADLLARAGIAHAQVAHPSAIRLVVPDVLIVAQDQLRDEPFEQSALVHLAAAGAGVLVLRQTQAASVAGYRLRHRAAPATLAWRAGHPAARHLQLLTAAGGRAECWALQLPADDPVLEIAWWPPAGGDVLSPIDALVAVKAVGSGQIVFCQLPLGPWTADPRSQLFLADMLDYLATRPKPTPPRSRREGGLPRHLKITTITPFSGG